MIRSLTGWLRLMFAGMALFSLAACAEGLETHVTRFRAQLPPPPGQSFVVVPEEPANLGGIEFATYAQDVAAQLVKLGYQQAPTPDAATLLVRLGYHVDHGRSVVAYGPGPWGPWHGYVGYGYGWAGPGWRPAGPWGWGWYDPWFDGPDSYTVYTSELTLRIDNHADGKRLFEGRAMAASTSNHLTYLVPNLIEAMFTGFPGNSGETVRITVAPEKR